MDFTIKPLNSSAIKDLVAFLHTGIFACISFRFLNLVCVSSFSVDTVIVELGVFVGAAGIQLRLLILCCRQVIDTVSISSSAHFSCVMLAFHVALTIGYLAIFTIVISSKAMSTKLETCIFKTISFSKLEAFLVVTISFIFEILCHSSIRSVLEATNVNFTHDGNLITIMKFLVTDSIFVSISLGTSTDSTLTPASNIKKAWAMDSTVVKLNSSAVLDLVTLKHAHFYAMTSLKILNLICISTSCVHTFIRVTRVIVDVFVAVVGLLNFPY